MIWQPQFLGGWGGGYEPAGMSDNWDKGLPSKGMKAKVNRKCHVSFFALTAETRSNIAVSFYLIFRIGPGIGVGVRTAPPRLRTPAHNLRHNKMMSHYRCIYNG